MHLVLPLVLSALLFSLGIYGMLARRNAVTVLMAIELMLNAANLNFVAFDAYLRDVLHGGQTFVLFIVLIAAAEVGVGLAIVLMVFRNRDTVAIDSLTTLADRDPVRPGVRSGDAEREAVG
jgi:NADH-quinone oxidoreductase subunit K